MQLLSPKPFKLANNGCPCSACSHSCTKITTQEHSSGNESSSNHQLLRPLVRRRMPLNYLRTFCNVNLSRIHVFDANVIKSTDHLHVARLRCHEDHRFSASSNVGSRLIVEILSLPLVYSCLSIIQRLKTITCC